ncbi:hypothetical protein CRG98_011847, partial [Punica granatum]
MALRSRISSLHVLALSFTARFCSPTPPQASSRCLHRVKFHLLVRESARHAHLRPVVWLLRKPTSAGGNGE